MCYSRIYILVYTYIRSIRKVDGMWERTNRLGTQCAPISDHAGCWGEPPAPPHKNNAPPNTTHAFTRGTLVRLFPVYVDLSYKNQREILQIHGRTKPLSACGVRFPGWQHADCSAVCSRSDTWHHAVAWNGGAGSCSLFILFFPSPLGVYQVLVLYI